MRDGSTPLRPHWLVSRPIAHRGLHDVSRGIVENTTLAAMAAIENGYSIECDVQISADGEAMVFHDDHLERLTFGTGRVDALKADALVELPFQIGIDKMVRLADFIQLIDAQTPLIVEIKSRFDGDMRLAARCAEILRDTSSPVALKSFDPAVLTHLREYKDEYGIGHVPVGIVAESHFNHAEWDFLTPARKTELANLLHWPQTRPDFLSWHVNDLPDGPPFVLRAAMQIPLMTWTVRTLQQLEMAHQWADQPVFEGIRP